MAWDVKVDKRAGRDEIAPGFKVPKRFRASFTHDEFDQLSDIAAEVPYDLDLVAVLEHGRMVVESFTARRRADGPAVSGEGLRAIPVAAVLHEAIGFLADELIPGPREDSGDGPSGRDDLAWRDYSVALEYRMANLLGNPPTRAVASAFKISHATAGRWIAGSRERGSLGPALEGQAGEGSD